jgi:ribonuclease J
MAVEVTFYGGVESETKGRLGGVQALFHDKELLTRWLLEFGQQPDLWNQFFGFPNKPKTFNFRKIARKFKLYADLEEVFRQDYNGFSAKRNYTPTDLEVLATHPHFDHVGGFTLLRPDLKIHMHQHAKLILYIWQQLSGRTVNQFVDYIEQFTLVRKKDGDPKRLDGPKATIPRDIHTFRDYERFMIGHVPTTAHPVDHSTPGSCAFIHETSAGPMGVSGDLRLRGRHRELTERFIRELREQKVKYLFWEGSLLHFPHEGDEDDLAAKVEELIRGKTFVTYAAPPRDLDRVASMYKAAAATGRILCVSPDIMMYLRAFNGANGYPKPNAPYIAVLLPKKDTGSLDNAEIPKDIIEGDYRYWERQYIGWKQWKNSAKKKKRRNGKVDGRQTMLLPDEMYEETPPAVENPSIGSPIRGRQRVSLDDIAKYPDKFVLYMPPAAMADMLAEIDPPKDSIYLRCHPAPWTKEMEVQEDRQVNTLGIYEMDDGEFPDHLTPHRGKFKMHTVHVTGHLNREENREIFASLPAETIVIPYHCMDPRDFYDIAKGHRIIIPILEKPLILD